MDLAQATNAPETLSLAGADYQVRLLTMAEWGRLTSWVKSRRPSPVTQALLAIQQAKDAGEPVDATTRDAILDHAQRSALAWPPRLGTEAWFEALNSIEGSDERLLLEVLGKTDLSFTEEKARDLAKRLSSDEWGDLFRVSLWGTHPRPKGGSGTATAETSPQTPQPTPTSGTTSSPG